MVIFLMGAILFGATAYSLKTNGPLIQWDMPVYKSLHTQALSVPGFVNEFMLFGYFIGKELIQVFMVVLGLYFLHKKLWRELTMMLVGSAGGSLIWHFINTYFNRPRPEAQLGISLTNPSFPSGHVSSEVLFYGLLAYLLLPKMPGLFWKWFLVIAVLLVLAFGGFSRVFQGGHYLSDVIAGYGWGLAWAGIAFTAVEKIFAQKGIEHDKKRHNFTSQVNR
jgi:undecaprenyl-diphosphatase